MSKRQRHVYPNHEIGHLFVHQLQGEARNGNHTFYFEGTTCYSYGSHFRIATFVDGVHGDRAILFNTAKYSVTTSQHQSIVRRAIPRDWEVFEVPNLHFGYSPSEDEHQHGENIKYFISEIAERLGKCVRARAAHNKECLHREAVGLRSQAVAYAEFFGLQAPDVEPIPDLDSKLMEKLKAREAKAAAEKAAKARQQQEERRQRALVLADDWRQGGPHHPLLSILPTMLRLEGHEVVTSLGARFPIMHAKRGLALVRAVREREEEWRPNGGSCRLGFYHIARVSPEGNVQAGCHLVTWDEIQRVAAEIDEYQPRSKCNRCQMLSINGMGCHETGCPNSGKTWSVEENDWIEPEEEAADAR